jgi:glycosyltransferase involved in cell wall biosynthesis
MTIECDREARVINVCVEHQPAHAGLYRGIQDFARALGGDILSFDGGAVEDVAGPGKSAIHRIRTGRGWLARKVLTIGAVAAGEADAIAADADLLVTHSLFRAHAPWARNWALRHGRPYWVVPHGCLDPTGLARRAAGKRLWLWQHGGSLFAEAHALVFATRRERDKAAAWTRQHCGPTGNAGRPLSVVAPWPVSLPSLAGVEAARETFRNRHDIPENAPILLWVGRLHTTKRPLHAIHAFAAAEAGTSHLVIVGMDENLTRARLQAKIPPAIAGRVHLIGELQGPPLAEVWLAADGYISLSAKENFGYAAADALAHGLPVILSPGHDLAYELPGADRGRLDCGWLLPDDSLQAAVHAIGEWSALVTASGGTPRRLLGLRETGRTWAADNLLFARFRDSLERLAIASIG